MKIFLALAGVLVGLAARQAGPIIEKTLEIQSTHIQLSDVSSVTLDGL